MTKEIPVYTYQTTLTHNGQTIWIATSYTTTPNATLIIEVKDDEDNDKQDNA